MKKILKKRSILLFLAVSLMAMSVYAQGNKSITQKEKEKEAFRKAMASTLYDLGNQNMKKGDLDKAILDYAKAIEYNPELYEAYYNRGLAFVNKGDHSQAKSDFSQVINVGLNNILAARSFYNRGLTYQGEKNYIQAVSDYTKSIEIDPKYAAAYKNRAVCYFYQKNYDLAWQDVHKVKASGAKIQMNPEFIKLLQQASGRQ